MQEFAASALADPIYGLIAAILVVGGLTAWVLRTAFGSSDAGDPLEGLFDRSTFDTRLETIADRPVRVPRRTAPLCGQRAQMARLREVWELDTRAEAIEEVARVMRASKDTAAAPVRMIDETSEIAESEWEEVKLLPPPASAAA